MRNYNEAMKDDDFVDWFKSLTEALKMARMISGMTLKEASKAMPVGLEQMRKIEASLCVPDIYQVKCYARLAECSPSTIYAAAEAIAAKPDMSIPQKIKLITDNLLNVPEKKS